MVMDDYEYCNPYWRATAFLASLGSEQGSGSGSAGHEYGTRTRTLIDGEPAAATSTDV